MNRQIERRRADPRADEALSPEFLKVLEVCGGEIRRGDRTGPADRRGPEPARDHPGSGPGAEPAARRRVP